MKLLSFDCANKSIAYAYMQINDLQQALTDLSVETVEEIQKNAIKIIKCDVVDMLNGVKLKDVNAVERSRALKCFLEKHIEPLDIGPETLILIENQPYSMGGFSNNASSAVASQLCFHFVGKNTIEFVSAKLKNKLAFAYPIEELVGGSKKYANRKKHSKDNCIKMLDIIGQRSAIKHIHKEFYDDVADAILQACAFYKFKIPTNFNAAPQCDTSN